MASMVRMQVLSASEFKCGFRWLIRIGPRLVNADEIFPKAANSGEALYIIFRRLTLTALGQSTWLLSALDQRIHDWRSCVRRVLAASMIHSIRNGFPIVLLFVHQVLARFP